MSENHHDGNGWNEWRKHVLAEISRGTQNTEDIRKATDASNIQFVNLISQVEIRVLEKLSKTNQEIAALKVKAGMWGGFAGLLTTLTILGMWLVQQASAAQH